MNRQGVEQSVDAGEGGQATESHFLRVILRPADDNDSVGYATLEHHYVTEDEDGASQWQRKVLFRGEPMSEQTAVKLAMEYAAEQEIINVYVSRKATSSDETVMLKRPTGM